MSFPAMGHSRRARVNIPDLRGGVNYRDALSAVEDDQLTDVNNLWFKDGALRTRPGMKVPRQNGKVGYTGDYEAYSADRAWMCRCPSGCTLIYTISGMYTNYSYNLYAFDADGCYIGSGTLSAQNALLVPYGSSRDGAVYDAIAYHGGTMGRMISGIRVTADGITVTALEPYVPVVMFNGKGRSVVGADAPGGALLEGYSVLTAKYRAYYNTDAQSTKYYLPTPMVPNYATLTYTAGTETWTWQLTNVFKAEQNSKTTVKAKLSIEGYVELSAALPEVEGASNNLCVTGSARDYSPEFSAMQAKAYAWFGGTKSGINGGTRLFLASGNKVYWSGVNDPFYFSENNYAAVGAATDSITAFGKQSDALVIFKEREIYYTTYNDGINVTAEDVVSGKVVDVSTLDATFPLAQLSGNIGCDLPHTVRLMQNRLIWADSAGKVWTLVYTSEYNQRNVRPVGGLIERKIKAHSMAHVHAAVYGDYYVLLVTENGGTTGYALDTAEYGYSYYTSHRNDERAQSRMAWYVWTFPQLNGSSITVLGSSDNGADALWFTLQNEADSTMLRKLTAYTFGDGGDETADYAGGYTETPIPCRFTTKLFDMDRPDREKMFDRLYIGFGQTEELNAKLTYITEKGEFEDSYRVTAEKAQPMWTAQFIRTEPITPNMRCRRFAVRVENTGDMYVEGLVLSYRV